MATLLHLLGGLGAAQIPPVQLDLTGCCAFPRSLCLTPHPRATRPSFTPPAGSPPPSSAGEMGASNGKPPAQGCGVAPTDSGDGLVYISQGAGGAIDACLLNHPCYRPALGTLSNTSSGAGMLRLRTLTDKGNCSRRATHNPHFPTDGLLESLNFILPQGWPTAGNQTWGASVNAQDLAGVFVNNDNVDGDAGMIFLSRRTLNPAACDRMRGLADCTATPPPLAAAEPASPQQPAAASASPTPSAAPTRSQRRDTPAAALNTTRCYRFGGSAGAGCPVPHGSPRSHIPCTGCGMQPARVNGHAYVRHGADGSVKVCLHQMCSRVLEGRFHTASNGVGFMLTQTDFAVVRTKSLPHFLSLLLLAPKAAL